jgi:two-component system cell cycle sensor histidine kinase/response regulator CckA
MVERIHNAGTRAVALTRQLLVFSRGQVLQPVALDLNRLVTGIETMLRRLIGENIEIATSLLPGLGCVKADPIQIEQVLMNLALNARDAMPHGGTITIETTNVELVASDCPSVEVKPGSYVMVALRDTGIGMDIETQAHMFEPFFTTKQLGKGTGLGLSTVYGIVTQSKGSIFVDSQPGKGTTFKIYFPRIAAKAEGLVQSSEVDELPKGSETILVVDDDDAVRKVAASLLSSAGYRIIEASNAEKALKIMTTLGPRIDLLLTDLIMFGKSGVELAEQAKAIHGYLPVLFMSGYAGDLLASRRGLLSEQAFVAKPFTRTSLLNMVYSALHRE